MDKKSKTEKTQKTEKSTQNVKVDDNHKVKVHYKGTFDNGDVFDSSDGKEPLEFVVGRGQVIKGFDDALKGMSAGDEKDISIEPEDAYGNMDDRLVQEVPKEAFGENPVKVGELIGIRGPNGEVMPAKIVDVKDDKVKLDLNHPMAGKRLNFNLKLVDTKALTPEEIAEIESHHHGHGCSDCGDHEHADKNEEHEHKHCGGGCC